MKNELDFYKRQPDKFLYDFFGVELNSVQKKLLDKIAKEDDVHIIYPMHRGYTSYKYVRWMLYQILFKEKNMRFWFCYVTGGIHNFNFHSYLCESDIEYYKNQGCKVKRIR